MSRPEEISDITLDLVEFASINVSHINMDPVLLKAYAEFLETVLKIKGVEVGSDYRGTVVRRQPTLDEQKEQLVRAQSNWDLGKKHYETLASVGSLEYSYQRSDAEQWANSEGMPFPPEHEPISDFHSVLASIDEVTA